MPPYSSPPVLGVSLRCDPRAPRLARAALEDAPEAATVIEDARLIASELVNHAVLHSGCESDDMIRLAAHLDDGFLIISVHHPVAVPMTELTQQADSPESDGLRFSVVEHLAHRWGAENPDGHRMWAALPVDHDATAPARGQASEC